jgi:hypothetical protein
MEPECECGHVYDEHDEGICTIWIEEEDRWCPCIQFEAKSDG